MARIVIDGREILGTTGRYIRKLLEYLRQIDTENEYIVLLHQEGYEKFDLSSSNFSKVLVSEKKFSFAEQIRLPKTIRALKPDLVHFTMTNQPAFIKGKIVTTIHDLTPIKLRSLAGNSFFYRIKSYIFGWLTKKSARKSARVLCGTQYVKNDVLKFTGVQESKVVVTREAADIISAEPKPNKNLDGKRFIFYAGRAQPHKNLETLIKSFDLLYASHPELLLALVGKHDSSYERIKKITDDSPARENIVFTGFVDDAELKWLYQNAAVYVFPSLSEGFGLPGLEAMVHGCPVVSSNATCLPEVYGDAAVYFDPNNPQDIADNIFNVISDNKLRNELVEKGYKQAAKYSWRRMAEQTLEIYKKVLNS